MSFQFCLAMINLNNFSPFSLIHFHLQWRRFSKTMENHCTQPGTQHIIAHEPKAVLRKSIKYRYDAFRKSHPLLTDENEQCQCSQ